MKKETDAYGDTSRLFLKECLFFCCHTNWKKQQ